MTNVVNFPSSKGPNKGGVIEDIMKILQPTQERRAKDWDEIIARMEALSSWGADELYFLWIAITDRLIESHDLTPGELVNNIRDHFGDDDDGESA